jgi:hypothetical protein
MWCSKKIELGAGTNNPICAHLDATDPTYPYSESNMEFLCAPCNNLKGNHTPETAAALVEYFEGREAWNRKNTKQTPPKSNSSDTKSAATAVQVTLVQHTATVIPFASRARSTPQATEKSVGPTTTSNMATTPPSPHED